MSSILAFSLFALVASITPGPTTLLVLTNSHHYGLRKVWPLIIGSCVSATIIVLLTGLGAGEVIRQWPLLKGLMTWGGALWLSWLSWQLYHASMAVDAKTQSAPAGWRTGATLQLINPKTWMMAMAVSSVYMGAASDWHYTMLLSVIFLLIAIPCLFCWALLGKGARRWLNHPVLSVWFSRSLAIVLLISVWWSLWLDLSATSV